MYEVGFVCEIHCNFIEYCFNCNKNLCEFCKIMHQHKSNEMPNIDNDVINKKYSFSYLTFVKNALIQYNCSQIYSDMKQRKIFNGYIYRIICAL